MAVKANPAYTTPLNAMPFRELLDVAKQVSDVEQTPGWRLLMGLIESHAERLQAQLLASSLPSYEKLAQLQGELRGLRALQEATASVEAAAQERLEAENARAEAHHGNA